MLSKSEDPETVGGPQVLCFINGRLDDLYFERNQIRTFDWKAAFLDKTVELEKLAQRKNQAMFRKVFIDSWKKRSIQPLIRKLDLSFQVHLNNDIKYLISNAKANSHSKFNKQKPKIQFNQESLSFDLVFDNHATRCPCMHEITGLKILATLKS